MSSSSRPSTSNANGSKEEPKSPPSKPAPKSSEFELDLAKLHGLPSEQQELYLFNFCTSLEQHVFNLKPAGLKAEQGILKKELVKIVHLQSPAPSRVIRNIIGRTWAAIFDRGDIKLLFESITELSELLGASKVDKDTRVKHAAAHCLGEIYKVAGDGAVNLTAVICPALVKLYKNASNHVALRAVVFKTLGKIVASVGGSMDEVVLREIWKQARNAASLDRGSLVQINACWCLEQLIRHTSLFDNTNDFDTLKTAIWKAGESTTVPVRHAAASSLASIMVKNFTEKTVLKGKSKPKPKKSKRPVTQEITDADVEELEAQRASSPTPKKSALELELPLGEILVQLQIQYVKTTSSARCRAMIVQCYSKVFQSLELRIVEANFGQIADHLLVDLLNHAFIANNRYRILLTRRFVQKLLGDIIGRQILGESAQMDAAKTIINDILRNYPRVLTEKPEPTKNTLAGALNVLGMFIQSLGSAFSPMADSCRDALIQILQHPSYTVQIHASYCLRLFVLACPQQLIQCASICMNSVTRELGLLSTERWSARKSLGYANGLSAVLSISSLQPLYSSLEISSRVLKQATSLLKSSASEEIRISGIQVQVAWVLIGGLMPLGPNFVKIHLNQLLLLWRNALPKPLTKENTAQRQTAELSYLALVRECALGSILSFLEFNNRLITTDVAKRLAALLQNTIEFLESLPPIKADNEVSPRITASLQLADLVQMVRRRVLQCYARLATQSPHTSSEILSDSKLLTFAVACFAEPENYPQGSLGTSIANSSANFESIWTVADNCGFGVSGLMRGLEVKPLVGEKSQITSSLWQVQLEPRGTTDSLLLSPVCGAIEHDSICVTRAGTDTNDNDDQPDPPATEVVNSAVALFAIALPLQLPKVQESTLENLTTSMSAKSLQRDPGRRAAIVINIVLALLGSLKVGAGELSASTGDLKAAPVAKALDDILRGLIISNDPYVRNAAYEAMGRLCNSAGNTFTETVVNGLVDTIVSNREPNARAGCAMALASIHSNVGGIAANFHLRKIHGVLMSLCSDPHPTVHFWAIEAMSKVAESASLDFASYLPSTLGLLAQMWISDSHGEEGDAIGTQNAELEMPTPPVIASCIASLINVLGPDLQDMAKARDLILTLIAQFDIDDSPMVKAQALNCWEHVYLYAPAKVDLKKYVRQLQQGMATYQAGLHNTAIDGLHNLMKRDAQKILDVAEDGIEDQIWTSLDKYGSQQGIKGIIDVWSEQTALVRTGEWISRCQELLTKTVAREIQPTTPVADKGEQSAQVDEEIAGFNVNEDKGDDGNAKPQGQELLKWQVREFALKCLSNIFTMCAKDMQLHPRSSAGMLLQNRVADIIRLAFLASTAAVVELRIEGLRLIDQVLTVFGRTPDPDFAEALLLEQYQAQISSALTPAFGADSSPELASAAISVCGTFISTGLVKDVERMGRILKLLISSLQSFTTDDGDPTIGDLKGLSSNAQRMVKMAVLSAWAQLQVASTEQSYLNEVVKPHVASLTPMWLESLQDFAKLRFEPDISSSMGASPDDPLDVVYAALNRETLLGFYQASWLTLVDAIASLIDQDSEFVFDALDRRQQGDGEKTRNLNIDYRNEPVAFFFILYGIAFEALVTDPGDQSQTLEILEALKKILRPSVSGNAIYQDVVFNETMELFDRLAQTEDLPVQGAIVEITRKLCLTHPTVGREANNEQISDDIEQLFELTRIIVLVLAGVLPNLGENSSAARPPLNEEAIQLVTLALDALVDASDVFPSVIKTDLHACIIHIFTTILGTAVCQAEIVPKALPIFKRFLETAAKSSTELTPQLRICLLRFRTILGHAQRRETEASLPCARNTLLASVILLGTGSKGIAPDDPLIPPLLKDILDCFGDRGLGKIAANCARSILLLDPKSATSQAVARYVLPRMLQFILDDSQSDPEQARTILVASISAYTTSLRKDTDAFMASLGVALPVLLQYASAAGESTYADVAGKLLAMAGANQAGFKGVAGALSQEQRALMEEIIRNGAGAREDAVEKEEPSIALKFSFGGR